MEVRVFGGIARGARGEPSLDVTSPRPRLILAMLAARAGSVVSEEKLIDEVWGDAPPSTARTALQTYVSAARDLIEPDRARRSPGGFIAHSASGYTLRSDAEHLDIAAFESRIAAARRLHLNDRPAGLAELDAALAMWQDPPFGEFAEAHWALGAVARLRELHAAGLESRFGLALDDGSEAGLLDRMETAVVRYPYRERLAGQLMLAHYRRGDQQRALQIYAETRRVLVEDLGLDPGRELQLLERAMLSQDRSLQTRTDHAGNEQPSRTTEARPARPVIGRAADIEAVVELTRSSRLVTIVGPGGVGKTSVAAHVVNAITAHDAIAVHHVCLSELGSREVMRVIAGAIRIVEHPLAPLADSITDAIGSTITLLVLETCEVASDETARAVAQLLRAPGLRVLATSQVPLQLQDETVLRLAPLTLEDAIELLQARSQTAVDTAMLAKIAGRVERLPLGLELAASRLDALGPEELLRGLESGADLLTGAVDLPSRQRSARATGEWSYQLLDADLQAFVRQLAVFGAPFTLGLVQQVVDQPDGASAHIGELVDRSLVVRVDDRDTRFRLPDTIRAVALGAGTPDVAAQQRSKLAKVVLDVAQSSVFSTPSPIALAEIDGEIVPALVHFRSTDDPRELALATFLGGFFTEHGRISEGREQLSQALDHHPSANPTIRLFGVAHLAFMAWYQGDLTRTRLLMADLVEVLDQLPVPGIADSVAGCAAFIDGDYETAATHLAHAVAATTGATKQRLMNLHLAGNTQWYAGDLEAAAAMYRAQRETAREMADDFALAQSLRFEAMVTAQRGDIEPAWRWAERSLSMSRSMADSVSIAQSSAASAVVATTAGAADDAHEHALNALEASCRHFDVFALRTVLPILADDAIQNDPERAARLLGWYLDLLERTGHGPSPASKNLAERTIEAARDQLGVGDFARAAAQGAAGRLVDVIAEARRLTAGPPVNAGNTVFRSATINLTAP